MAKKIKLIKVIVVDPIARTIEERETPNTLEALQGIVCGLIQTLYPSEPGWKGVLGYVNEEGLWRAEWQHNPWRFDIYDFLVGPGVFLGSGRGGGWNDCPVNVEFVRSKIQFSVPVPILV